MELEEDVDVTEFGPDVLRRQQVQSYLIKVLVPGLDDASKIQYYHRLATIFERAAHEMTRSILDNPTMDHSDTEYTHLTAIYEDYEELHVELSNILLLNNDDDMLLAVTRFVSAVAQDIRIIANTEDSEAEMTEKMLGILRRAPPSSPLCVYALGVLALLLRPQEFEVDAVRYVATTEVPEMLLKRLNSTVQALQGRALQGPFADGSNPIDRDVSIGCAPASVNEELDQEEPKLSELAVKVCELKWYEFTWSLEIIAQVTQYVDVLAPVLQNGGVELIHFLLTSQSTMLVAYGLSCLTSLVTHPKFAHLFLARDGLMLLLARPCAASSVPSEYNKVLATVINNLVQYPASIEQLCLLHEQALNQFLELIFWLFETAQEESLKTLFIAVSRLLVYETFVEIFQRQQHIDFVIKFWKFCQAIADGKLSPLGSLNQPSNPLRLGPIIDLANNDHHQNDEQHDGVNQANQAGVNRANQIPTNIDRPVVVVEGEEGEAPIVLPLGRGRANPRIHQIFHSAGPMLNANEPMDEDVLHPARFSSVKPQLISEEIYAPFKHLRLMSPASARSMIDHMMLMMSEYFSASCVQTWSASARHLIGMASLAAPSSHTLTPRYRSTNTSYEHIASCNIVHYGIVTLPDTTKFVQEGGLELLLLTLHSNIPFVPHSQTSTDITTTGLKLLWIFTMIQSTAQAIINLKIDVPEPLQRPGDSFARHIAARFTELLTRPNGNQHGDIPILGRFGDAAGERREFDEDDDDEDHHHNHHHHHPAHGTGTGGPGAGTAGTAPSNAAENNGGGIMDRIDTSNIRLEPVNQRLALERNLARQSSSALPTASGSPSLTSSSSNGQARENIASNQDAAAEQASSSMDIDPAPAAPSNAAVPSISVESAEPAPTDASAGVPSRAADSRPQSRSRTSVWLLLHMLRKLGHPSPPVALYVLQIFNNYLHPVTCRTCNVRQTALSWAHIAASEIRVLNGLSELVGLLKFHEINLATHSAQQLTTVVVNDWNIIRTHAMQVLSSMAHQDMAIQQILSKKLASTLPEILRVPCPPGLEKSFAKFKDEATEFLSTTTVGGSSFRKDDSRLAGAPTLSKLERASIIRNTPIRYSNQELLGLIYQHLHSQGLKSAADALAAEAKLSPDLLRLQAPPTAPKRLRRPSMAGSASATLTTASMATPSVAHPDAPLNEHGFLASAPATQISLDTIVKQYLFEQHRHCHHPVQVLPDLSLQAQHACPNPIHHRMNPYGGQSMNLAHRLMHHSLQHTAMRSPEWRSYKYSRFAPRRKFSDGGLLTSVTFVGNDSIFFGSGDGLVVKYNCKTVNYDSEWEVRDGPVDIKISRPSSRVLTMCEARNRILGAPEDVKIWDLANMSHELGTLPYVSANFSTSGSEVLGTNTQGIISLWDVQSGTVVRQFNESSPMDEERHTKTLQAGHFSPDDCLVLYNSTLWDKRKSTPIHNFDRFTMSSGVQLFAPSGLEVITNTEVWDARTFKLFKTVPSLHRAALTYSSSGDVLYCGTRSKVEILDGASYDYISQIVLESSFSALSVNPDDNQVAVLENLSPDRWPAESAWRIWDIGTSRTLDDQEGSDSEDDDADEMADFDSDRDLMDEDVDVHAHDDDDDDDDDEDGDDGDDDNGGGRGLGFPGGFFGRLGGTGGRDGEELMIVDDEDDEEGEWTTDTDYSAGDFGDYAHVHDDEGDDADLLDFGSEDELQFDSDGELIAIDDYDPEGDGVSHDDGDDGGDGHGGYGGHFDDSDEGSELNLDSEEEAILFGGRHAAASRVSVGRRQRRGSGGSGSRASSVFVELPSDEEAANELLEHGHITGDMESNSEPSVMEFDDDGEEVAPTTAATTTTSASSASRRNRPQAPPSPNQMQDISSAGEESADSEISRPPPPSRRGRQAKATASRGSAAPTTGTRRRGLPSLRELGAMLGLAGKRTTAAAATATAASLSEESSDDEEMRQAQSPPSKKKPRRK
jgi:hypothetical protein